VEDPVSMIQNSVRVDSRQSNACPGGPSTAEHKFCFPEVVLPHLLHLSQLHSFCYTRTETHLYTPQLLKEGCIELAWSHMSQHIFYGNAASPDPCRKELHRDVLTSLNTCLFLRLYPRLTTRSSDRETTGKLHAFSKIQITMLILCGASCNQHHFRDGEVRQRHWQRRRRAPLPVKQIFAD
jgi:hypothetical protein